MLTLAVLLIVIWLFVRIVFKIAGAAVHLLLIVAAVVLVWHLVTGGSPGLLPRGWHLPHMTRSR